MLPVSLWATFCGMEVVFRLGEHGRSSSCGPGFLRLRQDDPHLKQPPAATTQSLQAGSCAAVERRLSFQPRRCPRLWSVSTDVLRPWKSRWKGQAERSEPRTVVTQPSLVCLCCCFEKKVEKKKRILELGDRPRFSQVSMATFSMI